MNIFESKNIRSVLEKKIKKDAISFRKKIDKEREKEKKREIRDIKNHQKKINREIKKNIIQNVSILKNQSKDKNSFLNSIMSIKGDISDDLYNFIIFVAHNSDKLKTKSNNGTMLITKNPNVLIKMFDSPIVNNYMNDKIRNLISKFYRMSNPSINEKLKNNIFLDYMIINNSIFNIIKDVVFELIRCDLLSKEGLYT